LALMDAQRGPQLGSVPMADTNWEPTAGAGMLRGLPKINVTQQPVYRQDVEGGGSLLGKRLAQMQGWGDKPQEQTYPFTTGGQTVQLPGDQFATAALRRELDNEPGTGGGSRVPSGSRVAMEAKRSLGGDWRNAELLGVNDDILMAAEDAVKQGVPLQKALADAATQFLGSVDEGRIAGLSGQLTSLLPHQISTMIGDKTKVIDRAVEADVPKVVRGKGKRDTQAYKAVVPFKEALVDYGEFRKAWSGVIRNRKVTRREIAEIRERFGLTDEEFYSLLEIHNQAQGPQNTELDSFIPAE
jgi:hypothetical protein